MKYCIDALALTSSVIFLAAFASVFAATPPIPAEKSKLDAWYSKNVKPLTDRKGELDPALVAAEERATVVKVRADGSGDFKTVTEAITSVPPGNTKRVVIWIGGGVYKEKLTIDRTRPFITLYGSPNNMPNLTFDGDAKTYGTVYSASLSVDSDYFVAANLVIENSSPRPDGKRKGAQALAARLRGNKAAVYNCKFIGFQDTLCDDDGLHVYKDCFIQGTVDFVFGKGTSLFLNTQLDVVVTDDELGVITAHSREKKTDPSGYVFAHCSITGTGGRNTFLGRSWRPWSRVVYAYTTMADIINREGWNDMRIPAFHSTVFFGEYKCSGPGSETSGRVDFSKQLSNNEVRPFINLGFVQSEKWLLPPPQL
ncbi:pectinesterase PPME1-like [Cucurbita pepo subsp. pepo]|uniref:pectinesterase PPME1-like n=1 Tax=Cucurbita pepo subsp. pepo TaxID=3664 RepID=UPI000C9D6DA3|nr:pectinesterase PPME1-like [Cucurbita pepo subsp. pepo]